MVFAKALYMNTFVNHGLVSLPHYIIYSILNLGGGLFYNFMISSYNII